MPATAGIPFTQRVEPLLFLFGKCKPIFSFQAIWKKAPEARCNPVTALATLRLPVDMQGNTHHISGYRLLHWSPVLTQGAQLDRASLDTVLTVAGVLSFFTARSIRLNDENSKLLLLCEAKTRKPSTLTYKTTWIYNAKRSAVRPKMDWQTRNLTSKVHSSLKALLPHTGTKVSMLSTCVAVFLCVVSPLEKTYAKQNDLQFKSDMSWSKAKVSLAALRKPKRIQLSSKNTSKFPETSRAV